MSARERELYCQGHLASSVYIGVKFSFFVCTVGVRKKTPKMFCPHKPNSVSK